MLSVTSPAPSGPDSRGPIVGVELPETTRVPAEPRLPVATPVPPEYVLLPASVSIPRPLTVKLRLVPASPIGPEKVVGLFTVNVVFAST